MQSVKDLCGKIRENGAVPGSVCDMGIPKDGKQLQKFGIDYDEMYRKMHEAYAEAAEKTTRCSPMSAVHFMKKPKPKICSTTTAAIRTKRGSNLAAETIAEVILKDANA